MSVYWNRAVWIVALLLALAPQAVLAQSVEDWLRGTGMSEKEMSGLDAGEPVVRVPKSDDPAEVTLLAVVRVDASPETIRQLARDVSGLAARNDQVLEVGVYSAEPERQDAAALHLPEGDVKDLRKCRVGDCAVRLTEPAIDTLQATVDWSSPDPAVQVNDYMATWLTAYLLDYQRTGAEALAVYADKEERDAVAEGLDALLRKTELAIDYDPDFHRYVASFPQEESPGVENLYYWTLEDLSLKPTLFLNHMAIRGGDDSDVLVIVKQIYASHYIQAGVTVYAALSVADEDPSSGVYVFLTQRLRFDGKVGGIKRKALEEGTKKAAREQLEAFRQLAEAMPSR